MPPSSGGRKPDLSFEVVAVAAQYVAMIDPIRDAREDVVGSALGRYENLGLGPGLKAGPDICKTERYNGQ